MGCQRITIEIVVFMVVTVLTLSTCRPHHRRRCLERAWPQQQQQQYLCSHVTRSRASDHLLTSTQLDLIKWDIERLTKELACKIDKTDCNRMYLDIIAGTTRMPHSLSHLSYSSFIDQMTRQLRSFYGDFSNIASQLSRLQSSCVLDTRDKLSEVSQIFVNDIRGLICFIQKSTHVKDQAVHIPNHHMDESSLYLKFIPLLKEFTSFIAQCDLVLNRQGLVSSVLALQMVWLPIVNGYMLEETVGFWSVNTCNCSFVRRQHSFKACKLISLRETLVDALEVVKDLNRALADSHRRDIEGTEEIVGTNSQFELLHDGYNEIQRLALDYLILEQSTPGSESMADILFPGTVDFAHSACRLRHYFKRLMCQIKPVLNAGIFDGREMNIGCEARRRIHSRPTRSQALYFAENLMSNSTVGIQWMITSINGILTDI